MIRWTFIFNDDKHISVDVRQEEEDNRILDGIDGEDQFLFIPSLDKSVYVNLAITKLIIRDEIKEEAPATEIKSEPDDSVQHK